MKHTVQLIGFVLIIIGMVGLVTSEFLMAHSSMRTIVFAGIDLVGLVLISFAHWGMKSEAP